MGRSTKITIWLFLPILTAAIRLEGDEEVTKPPQRQEFLWKKSSQNHVRWPAEAFEAEAAQGVTHVEGRFQRGSRPTVASYPYWLTASTSARPNPPTVAPLPPHMQSDPFVALVRPPAETNLRPSSSSDPRTHGRSETRTTTAAPARVPWVRGDPRGLQSGVSPVGGRSLGGGGGSSVEGLSPTECTGRGHSWGCGPFGRESAGEGGKIIGSGRAVGEYRENDGGVSLRREVSSPPKASGGWTGVKEWCLLPTGQFPYPIDCRRFVNCWNGIGYVQACAPGTLFNADTLECDFPSKVSGCGSWNGDVGRSPAKVATPSTTPGQWQRPGTDLIGAASGSFVKGDETDYDDYGGREMDIRVSHRQLTGAGRVGPSLSHEKGARAFPSVLPTTTTAAPPPAHGRITGTNDRLARGFQTKMSCPEPNGIFPHPEFCDRFINCHQGRPYSMMCGPGTLFDAKSKSCDHAHKVKCSLSGGKVTVPPATAGKLQRPGTDLIGAASGSFVKGDETDYDDYGGREIDIRVSHRQLTGAGRVGPSFSHEKGARAFPSVLPTTTTAAPPPAHGRITGTNDRLARGFQTKTSCPEPNGIFPHPDFCDRFINCHQGRPYSMMCGPGTLFDPKSKSCDHARNVHCLSSIGKVTVPPATAGKLQRPGTDLIGAASGSFVKGDETDYDDYGGREIDIRVSHRQLTGAGRVGPSFSHEKGARAFPSSHLTATTTTTTITVAPPVHGRITGTSGRLTNGFQTKMSCPEPNGIFPHPEFCDRFMNCHQGRPHGMMCGPGTHFDPKNKRCDHAHKVKCSLSRDSTKEVLTPEESRHVPVTHIPPRVPSTEASKTAMGRGGRGEGVGAPLETEHAERGDGSAKGTMARERVTTTTAPPATPAPSRHPHLAPIWPPEGDLHQGIPTPHTGQSVRLRGGHWPWEGYVEIYAEEEEEDGSGGKRHGVWSPVCDKPGKWSLGEGSVVCRQLGYHRGADMTWQGKWVKGVEMTAIHVGEVKCGGQEASLSACHLGPLNVTTNGHLCDVNTDAVGVRCLKEYRSLCGVTEVPYGGHCYSVVTGSPGQKYISRETAAKECQKRGALLADIFTQEENDFVSEWLFLRHPEVLSLMTGGVGMPMGPKNIWMWEASQFAISYSNWWNGWQTNAERRDPDVLGAKCVMMSRKFPCPAGHDSRGGALARGGSQPHHKSGTVTSNLQWCQTEYHFWSAQECNMLTHGAICKRNPDDIGCVWNLGMDYMGRANVTHHGSACLRWDESPFGHPHPDSRLQGHNLCRNYGGTDGGGAAEGHPWCYVDARGGWESCEIPPCRRKDKERSGAALDDTAVDFCGNNEFACKDGECITKTFVCDGLKDCSNGKDEMECQGLLKEFRRKGGTKWNADKKLGDQKQSHMLEKWVDISAEDCASYCLKKEGSPHHCNSFSYHLKDRQCLLVGNKDGEASLLPELQKRLAWDHYELLPPTVNCRGMFHCKNGSCIDSSKVCNGMNDCGDHSDEVNCSSEAVGFSLQLVGGNVSHEGRIEVKAFGRWGVVCDDLFGLADADVVCREAGYALGAAEVVLHSGFGSGVIKGPPLFIMDDLECIGTEKSLSECQFPGWGHHNCGPEEVAGVVCKVPGAVCQEEEFHCRGSQECIPLEFLCDNLKDCEDGSDEDPSRCQSEVLVRLAEGPTNLEGRVEVRYHGIWGTVCDDDFGVPDAQVICRNLGLGWGPGVLALKDAHYGPGKGPIWLDELHCSGKEERVVDCPRFPWGKNNCGHKEDASVKCTAPGDVGFPVGKPNKPVFPQPTGKFPVSAQDILPTGCGIQSNISTWLRALGVQKDPNAIQPRVVGGQEFRLGAIPWQASLRVRSGPGKSVHWCGAVVLSPLLALTAGHCIQDYSKEAYILRVGDYDSKLEEGTEQEAAIAEVYMHEDFNKGPYLNSDIAVVKLKAPGVHFTDQVHAICLPRQEEVIKERTGEWRSGAGQCVISGWGSVGVGGGFSRTLRSAVVPLLSQAVCQAPHVYGRESIGMGMSCAGSLSEGGIDSCQGDSGGPLVCFEDGEKPILYGITSWGQGCGRANKPGVYSRISFFRSWIDKKVQEAMLGI